MFNRSNDEIMKKTLTMLAAALVLVGVSSCSNRSGANKTHTATGQNAQKEMREERRDERKEMREEKKDERREAERRQTEPVRRDTVKKVVPAATQNGMQQQ